MNVNLSPKSLVGVQETNIEDGDEEVEEEVCGQPNVHVYTHTVIRTHTQTTTVNNSFTIERDAETFYHLGLVRSSVGSARANAV